MYANCLALLTITLAAVASADDFPGTEHQRDQFVKHLEELKHSYKNSPEATSLAREIQPYITAQTYAQATALVKQFQAANIPQDASQFSTWAANPLIYATSGPQPDFVRNMPEHVKQKYLNAQYDQLKAAASVARKDFGINSASSTMPHLGWVMGAAIGGITTVALLL